MNIHTAGDPILAALFDCSLLKPPQQISHPVEALGHLRQAQTRDNLSDQCRNLGAQTQHNLLINAREGLQTLQRNVFRSSEALEASTQASLANFPFLY